jgi:ribosomal protein S18 acetylase RimI-like enzyme
VENDCKKQTGLMPEAPEGGEIQFWTATPADFYPIVVFLEQNERRFIPRLKDTVPSVEGYVSKVLNNGEILLAGSTRGLVGWVAIYCNDLLNRTAFLTSILVAANYCGRGVGAKLLRRAMSLADLKGMTFFKLEVSRQNKIAIQLYQHEGFISVNDLDLKHTYADSVYMEANLKTVIKRH